MRDNPADATSRANRDIKHKCPRGEHDIAKSATTCGKCGAVLCDICGSDAHFVSEGHDLNNPRYWGV